MSKLQVDLISDILTQEYELYSFVDYYVKFTEHNKEELENLYNLLTAFIDVEQSLKEKGLYKFVEQYYEILSEVSKDTLLVDIPLLNMIQDWLKFKDDKKMNHRLLCAILEQENIIINFKTIYAIKLTWSIDSFRNTVSEWQRFDSGIDYEDKYLNLYDKKYNLSIDILEYLLNDITTHDHLLDYINDIIKVNEEYNSMNVFATMIGSSPDFLRFIMKVAIKIGESYGIEKIVDGIKESVPFFRKLYISIMNSIWLGHLMIINSSELRKIFFTKKREGLGETGFEFDYVESCKIQKYSMAFVNLYPYFKTDPIIQNYSDYTFVCSRIKEIVDSTYPFNNESFQLLTTVIGDNEVISHYRDTIVRSLLLNIRTIGYEPFGKNFFVNLLKFISEVDIYSINQIPSAITLHRLIIDEMNMLLDYTTALHDQSQDMIAKTLFNLESRALDVYGHFQSLSKYINEHQDNVSRSSYILAADMIVILRKTLEFHSGIYEKNLITETFPSVEDKYSILIFELLKLVNNPIENQVINSPIIIKSIIDLIYRILCKHVKHSVEYLVNFKDIIIKTMDESTLSQEQKDFIAHQLNNYVEEQIPYPNEFLDPLTCKPIKNPVKLPKLALFFDRTGILTHVYEKGENPYTREKLSVSELDTYNRQQDIVDETSQFLERKRKFEEEYRRKV